MTPLHFAARKGSAEVVRLLLEAKADKDKATLNVGTTPMQPDMNLGYFASIHWSHSNFISFHFPSNPGALAPPPLSP
jgi:ankyrin repeat protein